MHDSPTPNLSRKPRFGVGYEEPNNRTELFGDGTPATSKPMRDAHSSETVTLLGSGKIKANPGAGDVRTVELNGKWMEFWNDRVEAEMDKAKVVLYEKRIFGLAKQTAAGLLKIGCKKEMTTIANVVRMAIIYKESGIPKGQSEARSKEMEKSSRVLDAIMCYDMVKVANLLEIPPEVPKTFGNDSSKR